MNGARRGAGAVARGGRSGVLAVAAAAVVGTVAVLATGCEPTARPGPGDPLAALAGETLLREPFEVRSLPVVVGGDTVGLLDAEMEVVLDSFAVPGAGTMQLRAYRLTEANGVSYRDTVISGFPGPTFRIQPGDSVRIRLVNRLPDAGSNTRCVSYAAADTTPPRDTVPNCFHGSNWTNIHYHGFHVTPRGTGDNVLLQIQPGDTFQYAFRVPLNQSPGTHWYHPHKHGAVAIQVTNGMSGAFIVEGGGLDSLTRDLDMTEHLVAVQQVDSQLNLVGAGGSGTKLVNGQATPTVVMRPREVQRWRIVNENVSKVASYSILFADQPGMDEPRLFDVARDGVQFAPANYDPDSADVSLFMAPGNRLDVFVQAPDSGVHELTAPLVGELRALNELPRAAVDRARAANQPLLRVVVVDDGAPVNTTLPAALPPLPPFLANLPATADTAAFLVFTEEGSPGGGGNPPSVYLGTLEDPYQKFDPDSVFLSMALDSVQTWKVLNQSVNQTHHPFHIHVNPFQILHVEYPATDPNAALYAQLNAAANRGAPIWMDTFALPLPDSAGNPGYAVIRQQYLDFTGQYVMHCHILGHEERGMMQLLEVVDPYGGRATAGAAPGVVPLHHHR